MTLSPRVQDTTLGFRPDFVDYHTVTIAINEHQYQQGYEAATRAGRSHDNQPETHHSALKEYDNGDTLRSPRYSHPPNEVRANWIPLTIAVPSISGGQTVSGVQDDYVSRSAPNFHTVKADNDMLASSKSMASFEWPQHTPDLQSPINGLADFPPRAPPRLAIKFETKRMNITVDQCSTRDNVVVDIDMYISFKEPVSLPVSPAAQTSDSRDSLSLILERVAHGIVSTFPCDELVDQPNEIANAVFCATRDAITTWDIELTGVVITGSRKTLFMEQNYIAQGLVAPPSLCGPAEDGHDAGILTPDDADSFVPQAVDYSVAGRSGFIDYELPMSLLDLSSPQFFDLANASGEELSLFPDVFDELRDYEF